MNQNTEPSKEQVYKILKLFEKRSFEELSIALEEMINLYPDGSSTWLFVGMYYSQINKLNDAENSFLKSLSINPNYAESMRLLADVLRRKGKAIEAIDFAKKAIEILPNHAPSYDTLGTCYASIKNYKKAKDNFNKSLKLNENPVSYNNLGNALRNLGNFEESISVLKKAIKKNPNIVQIFINLSLSYFESGDYNNSLKTLEKIKTLKIDKITESSVAAAYGHIYRKLHKFDLSEKYYLIAKDTSNEYLSGVYDGLAEINSIKLNHIDSLHYIKKGMVNPSTKNNSISNYIMTFSYFCKTNNEDAYKKIIKYANKLITPKIKDKKIENIDKKKFIRVGFISGDFHEHPVSFFLKDMISNFNDNLFESYAYYNHYLDDKITKKLKQNFTKFKYIHDLDDNKKLDLIISDKIDILIDLSGHTARNSLPVLKVKAAPIQMTWLGFSETTGIKEIDYIICDKISIPKNEEKFFIEKPIRLKNSYYLFSNPGENNFPIEQKSKDELIYGCFANIKKINDNVIETWAEILSKNKKSKLFLKSQYYRDQNIRENILNKFLKRKINENRIIFSLDSLRENYLLEYNNIDVILDTYPYPGGTTTCESFFMGTPVITMKGSSFLSRNGENILRNSGFSYLIANNKSEYVDLAINIKDILNKLGCNKEDIRKQFINSPIMNQKEFTLDFKENLKEKWKDYISKKNK